MIEIYPIYLILLKHIEDKQYTDLELAPIKTETTKLPKNRVRDWSCDTDFVGCDYSGVDHMEITFTINMNTDYSHIKMVDELTAHIDYLKNWKDENWPIHEPIERTEDTQPRVINELFEL